MSEIPDGITIYNGECFRCDGTGKEPDVPHFLVRILPPGPAQAFHELLQENFPDHDEVSCYCCCLDCPGWTQDEEAVSEEEIAEIIPSHDYDSGKPSPFTPSPGTSACARI